MDAVTRLMIRARLWREAQARRKEERRNLRTSNSRFSLESLEPRLLLSGTPIAVTQFTADASGFTAQFSQAVDATVLNLYDTEAGVLGPADITVVGASQGPVIGSLVVNNDQVAFVKAGGVLSPDVYTVTMRSASNGVKGADGSLLDGNNDGISGDAYVHAFTVGLVPSAVISVRDFASGPAQFINSGSGLPVTLSDGTNVTDVRFSINYDPALFRIAEVHPGSSLPNGSGLQVDLTQSGVVTVHISSPSSMPAGSVELIRLIAEVPADASYARSGVLDLSQISMNNGAIPAVGDDGVQVVAYFGDTTGNQRYSSLDGSRALRVVAGLDGGFLPYPTIDPTIIADITGNNTLSSLDATRILQEVVGLDRAEIPDIVPVILVGLVDDTGASDTDLITANPAVSGTLSDDGTITNFRVGLDDMLPADFVNVTAELQGTNFSFTRERLEQILGVPLADGIHTVHLEATDDSGIGPFIGGPTTPGPVFDPNAPSPVFNPNAPSPVFNPGAPSPVFNPSAPGPVPDPNAPGPAFDESVSGNTSIVNLTFTLDTTLPANTSVGLSAGSDTGPPGDNTTAAGQVLLIGASEAGATLTLNGTSVLAGAGGVFQIPDVDLLLGANAFTLTAADLAGNIAQRTLTINRLGQVSTDVALQWNQQTLEAIRMTVMDPPLAARVLAMVSLAQYDTLAAIDGTPAYLIHQSVTGPVSVDAALAKAAYTVLYALFPNQRAAFDAVLNGLLATITNGPAKTNALALGLSIGSSILAIRSNDGSDEFVEYPGSSDVGMWRPTAPMFDVASEPQWGEVTPFALTSGDEFRPVAPPALDSAAYAQSLNEIQSLGSATSSTRTADQTQIAQFWADGKGSYTPVGHWDLIAQQIALSKGNSLSSNVRLFAQLNVAMADAGIAVWDSKYTYGLWRPIDAIHDADQDGNGATIQDPNWTPLLITPSFPEYTSGHSTFSAAAAAILAAAFGDNTSFSATAFTLPGVTRNFTSFTQAAQEAGRSRIYGGIHYEFTNQVGQQLGQQVAAAVLDRFALNKDLQPPAVIADTTPEATNSNVLLAGQILDNLSGVAQAQLKIDNGFFQTLPLDIQGHFSITTNFALNGSSDGLHTLIIRSKDDAGNSAPDFKRNLLLDTVLPSFTLGSILNNSTVDTTTLLTGAADPTGSNLAVLHYKWDNGTPHPMVFDSATGSFNEPLTFGSLGVGSHTLTLTAQDTAGNQATLTRNVTLAAATPLTITDIAPGDDSGNIGSTFRPQVFFSKPIQAADLNSNNFFATDSSGNKLAATIVPAQDRGFAWLFLTNPMPGGETITINVNGSTIHSQDGTQLLDADGDGLAGGLLQYQFTTVSLEPIPGTTLSGRVFDPGPDLQPMTFDDIRRGPDGIIHTADDVFLNPIAGAKVFILGRESEFVFTDAQGRFTLNNVPAGDVKLVIDGRTATNTPAGIYFPEMVMDVTIEPGLPNTVMGSMGSSEEQRANELRDEVYLPRLALSILQAVSSTQNTVIGVDAASSPNLTDEERAQLKLVVQPGSLLDANGNPVLNGQVGISTVPPELVRDMLPPGVLQHTFDITIQAPGVAVFNTPLEISFPNVFNAAPGERFNFLSFDHTTGRLVIEGTATVSADGLSVVTDPGQGITKPGWHGLPPLGVLLQGSFVYVAGLIGKDKERLDPPQSGYGASGIRGSYVTEPTLRFDFGTATSPLQSGYTRITPSDVYNPSAGYGWDLAPDETVVGVDRAASAVSNLRRDFIATTHGTFIVDLPEGYYGVTITLGDAAASHNEMGVFEQGVFVNNVSTLPGQFIKNLYVFPVFGGRMILTFAGLKPGTDPVAISSIEIQPLDDEPLITTGEHPRPLGDRPFFYAYDNLDTGFVIRGSATSLSEIIDNIVFAPNTRYLQFIFDPSTLTISSAGFTTPAAGKSINLPAVVLEPPYTQDFEEYVVLDGKEPPLGGDSDQDGLSDDMEFVIGTDPHKKSTANDGISDLAKVLAGIDPLGGRALSTGIVGSLSLLGEAKAIAIEGSSVFGGTQNVYVATGSYGLAVVNATQFQKPVVMGQLDLSGDAVDVSVDSQLGIAAVASGAGGLHIVNVSNPTVPLLRQTIAINATQVEVLDGMAYASVGTSIRAYDLLTGELIELLELGGSNIVALARDGLLLYSIDSNRTMRAIDRSSGLMIPRGSILVPAAASKLFVGGGVAYIGAEATFQGGIETVNVADPDNLTLLSGVDSLSIAGKAIAVNGSGLAVTVGSPGNFGNLVQVLNVTNPTVTSAFLTQFVLPADPFDVAIGAGIAFIADGTGDLKVVNYLSPDGLGVPPVVNAIMGTEDLDPNAAGIQLLEGSHVQIGLTVSDDVQVRNTELLVNGLIVQNDVSFPFNLDTVLPTIAASESDTITLQVRVHDTGGNVGLSAPIAVQIVPDTFGPTLVTSSIVEGGAAGKSFRSITLTFSEAINQASFSPTAVQLIDSGSNSISPQNIQFRNLGKQVQLTFAQQTVGSYTMRIDRTQVRDNVGNAMGAGFVDTHFAINPSTIEWIAAAGGNWNTAANWSTGVLPTATDDVFIGATSGPVTISAGAVTIQTLVSKANLTLSGGTLTLNGDSEIDGAFTQSGGTLAGPGTITFTGAGNQWTGGTMTGNGITRFESNLAISGAAQKSLTGGRILNLIGTTTWNGNTAANNNAIVFGGGTINNVGTWNDANAFASFFDSFTGVNAFNNTGTYIKQNATTTTMEIPFLNSAIFSVNAGTFSSTGGGTHTGTFNIASGAILDFNSGTHNLNAITTAGTGTVQVSGSTSFNFVNMNGGNFPTAVVISGGNLQGTGTTFAGAVNWTGGTITGAGNFTFNSTLSITGAGQKSLAGNRILNLNGTTTWSGNTAANNNAIVFSGGTINNTGTWNDANAFASYFNLFTGVNVFNNTGTYNKQNATITTMEIPFINSATFNVNAGTFTSTGGGTHTGTFNIASGAILDFNAGTHNLNAITTAGAGTLQVSGSASFNFVNMNGGNFPTAVVIGGGNLQGTGTTFAGAVNWTGGTITGAGSFTFSNTLGITGAAQKSLTGNRILNLNGTTTWTGNTAANNNAIVFGGGTINNVGTWNDANAFASFFDSFTGVNVFNNAGTYSKQNATITTMEIPFINSATFNVNAGTFTSTGGGTHTGTFNIASGAILDFNSGTHNLNAITTAGTGTVQVSGSTSFNFVNMNGGNFPTAVVISGGNLQGTGTTFAGAVNWTGGTITGAGNFTFNSTLSITGAGQKSLAGNRILNLNGTTTWSGNTAANNNAIVFSGGTINNTGTWNDANAFASYFNLFTGVNVFNNTGTYNKQNATITTMEIPFLNSAIFNVNAGTFTSTGGGTHTGTFNVAGSAILDFNNGTHNLNAITTAGAGTLQVSGSASFNFVNVNSGSTLGTGALTLAGGNLTFSTDAAIGSIFTFSGGVLGGTGTVTLTGTGNQWSGGTMSGSGVTQVNSNLAITGNTIKGLFDGRVLNLTATTTWSGNTVLNNNTIQFGTGTINNSGTFNDANAFGTFLDVFSGTNAFNNTGSYNKQGSATTTVQTSFNSSNVVNVTAGSLLLTGGGTDSGSFNVASGAILDFNSGTHNLNNAAVAGAGTLQVSGSTSFNFVNINSGSTLGTGALTLAGGNLTFNTAAAVGSVFTFSGGVLGGGGTLTLTGTGNQWSGGTMSGSGITQVNSNLAITGNTIKGLFGGRVLNLTATTTWSGNTVLNNNIIQFGTGTINNSGTFNDANAFGTFLDVFSGTNAFNNTGTYIKQGSATTTVQTSFNNSSIVNINAGALLLTSGGTHTGTFDVQGGATLQFTAGTNNVNGGSITGAGGVLMNGAVMNINSAYSMASVNLSAGTLTGAGALTINGTGSQWTGGTMTGGGTTKIAVGASFTISGTGIKTLGNRTIQNEGTLTDSSTGGRVELDGAVVLNNVGLFDIRNDSSITSWDHVSGAVGSLAFNNSGTLKKSLGIADFLFNDTTFNNTGTIQILLGRILINGVVI